MRKLLPLGLLFSLSLFCSNVFSQKLFHKFGKIEEEELKATTCPIDPNAHAYYIFDNGQSLFQYGDTRIVANESNSQRKGFQINFHRHFKIKILDKEGLDWGNISIPLYKNASNREKLVGLKAVTYNLVDGKVEKSKLSNKDVLTEETSKHFETNKFAMPDVRAGSIIEVTYTIESDFLFNLQQWYFQWSIPALESKYTVAIPEYFHYNQTQKGYYPVKREETSNSQSLNITYVQRKEGLNVQSGKYTNTFDYVEDVFTYSANNIPAFSNEKYLRTPENYRSKIEFELAYTKFPGQTINTYTTTWKKIDQLLLDDYNFGQQLNHAGYMSDDINALKSNGDKGLVLINDAYNLIKQKIQWNSKNSVYTSQNLAKVYKIGEGNCSEINLNLVSMLRQLGFDAYPVVLSTRSHGIIYPTHPSISSFNYVIAMVKRDDKIYLLDATDPLAQVNFIPTRCLNDKGRIIGFSGDPWINLMNHYSYSSSGMAVIKLDSALNMTGRRQLKLMEYAAFETKHKLKREKDSDKSISEQEEKGNDFKVTDVVLTGLDNQSNDLTIKYKLAKSTTDGATQSLAYFAPVVDLFFDKNPFQMDKRQFPVEFIYPYHLRDVYVYTLPSNYEVAELPKPLSVTLPNNAGSFKFLIQQAGNSLNISTILNINKSVFLSSEYAGLKQFIQMVIDKEKEMVVLKAKS